MKKVSTLIKEMGKRFPDVLAKDGSEYRGLILSGEGSYMPDGLRAFDPWIMDYSEEQYTMMVHNDLHNWAYKNNCFWECHDNGTFILRRI